MNYSELQTPVDSNYIYITVVSMIFDYCNKTAAWLIKIRTIVLRRVFIQNVCMLYYSMQLITVSPNTGAPMHINNIYIKMLAQYWTVLTIK